MLLVYIMICHCFSVTIPLADINKVLLSFYLEIYLTVQPTFRLNQIEIYRVITVRSAGASWHYCITVRWRSAFDYLLNLIANILALARLGDVNLLCNNTAAAP